MELSTQLPEVSVDFTSTISRKPEDILNRDVLRHIAEYEYSPEMDLALRDKMEPSKIDLRNITKISINFSEVIRRVKSEGSKILDKLYRMNSLISLTFWKPDPKDIQRKSIRERRNDTIYYYIIHRLLVNNSETLEYLDMGDIIPEDDVLLCKNLKQINMLIREDDLGFDPEPRQILVCRLLHLRGCVTPLHDIDIPEDPSVPGKFYIKPNALSFDTYDGNLYLFDKYNQLSVYDYLHYHPSEREKYGGGENFFSENKNWRLEEGSLVRFYEGRPKGELMFEVPESLAKENDIEEWYIPIPSFLHPHSGTPGTPQYIDFSEAREFFEEFDSRLEEALREKLEEMKVEEARRIDRTIKELKKDLKKAMSYHYPEPKIIKLKEEISNMMKLDSELELSEWKIREVQNDLTESLHDRTIPKGNVDLFRELFKAGSRFPCYPKLPTRPEYRDNFSVYFRDTFLGGIDPVFTWDIPDRKYDLVVYLLHHEGDELNEPRLDTLKEKSGKLFIPEPPFEMNISETGEVLSDAIFAVKEWKFEFGLLIIRDQDDNEHRIKFM